MIGVCIALICGLFIGFLIGYIIRSEIYLKCCGKLMGGGTIIIEEDSSGVLINLSNIKIDKLKANDKVVLKVVRCDILDYCKRHNIKPAESKE